MVQDPYKVIGVSQGASADEIKRAYREKAKLYHPDLHPNDAAAAKKMAELNEAYDMLMNPEKYERKRAQQSGRGAYGGYGQGGYGSGYGQTGYGQSGYNQGDYRKSAYSGSSGNGYDYNDYGSYGDWGFFGFNFEDLFGGGGYRQESVQIPQARQGDSAQIQHAIREIQAGRAASAVNVLAGITSGERDARWCYIYAFANMQAGNTVAAFENAKKAVQMEPQNQEYKRLLAVLQQTNQSYTQKGSGFNMNVMYLCCTGLCAAQFLCPVCGGYRMFWC